MLQGALRSSRSLTVWARFKIGAAFFAIAKNLETVRPYFHEVTRLRCFSDATLDRRSDDRLATLVSTLPVLLTKAYQSSDGGFGPT